MALNAPQAHACTPVASSFPLITQHYTIEHGGVCCPRGGRRLRQVHGGGEADGGGGAELGLQHQLHHGDGRVPGRAANELSAKILHSR